MSEATDVPAEQRAKIKLRDAVLCLEVECEVIYSIRQTTGGGWLGCPGCGSQVRFPVSRVIRPLEEGR